MEWEKSRAVSCPERMGIAFSNFRGKPVSWDVLEGLENKFGFPQIFFTFIPEIFLIKKQSATGNLFYSQGDM
jgi:hypothetical protein